MFSWYQASDVCYAYLEDVDSKTGLLTSTAPSAFVKSRWFTRGWTLQELVAPPRLIFFGSDWKEIGSRMSLIKTVAQVTGIDPGFFEHGTLSRYSIAQRMSWAAGRETTRAEDVAYSLLGLFGVTMPLLYGEGGDMAFIRLQEEIMRRSDDHSIFAWSNPGRLSADDVSGMLAKSPADFAGAAGVARVERDLHKLPPFAITNKGIQITLPTIGPDANYSLPFIPSAEGKQYGAGGVTFAFTTTSTLVLLSCWSSAGTRVGIYLNRGNSSQPYVRSDHDVGLIAVPETDVEAHATLETILARASEPRDSHPLWPGLMTERLVIIKGLPPPARGFRLARMLPRPGAAIDAPRWITYGGDAMAVRLGTRGQKGIAGLLFKNAAGRAFCVLLEAGDETVLTELTCNLDPARLSAIETEEQWRSGGQPRGQAVRKVEQETGSDGEAVAVSIETRMMPHGALVWIRVEALTPALTPTASHAPLKRPSQFLDVAQESKKLKT